MRSQSCGKLMPAAAADCGKQARSRHARHRVHLEAPRLAALVEPKVDAAVRTGLDGAMRLEAEFLDEQGYCGRKVRRKDFLGPARLILARVVEDLAELRTNLADGERAIVKDANRQLASRNERLQHRFVIERQRAIDGGANLVRVLHHREADRGSLLTGFHDQRQPKRFDRIVRHRRRHTPRRRRARQRRGTAAWRHPCPSRTRCPGDPCRYKARRPGRGRPAAFRPRHCHRAWQ